jgi:hypothetical protein
MVAHEALVFGFKAVTSGRHRPEEPLDQRLPKASLLRSRSGCDRVRLETPAGHAERQGDIRLARSGTFGLREWAAVAFLYRLMPPRPTFAQDMSSAEADVMRRHVAYWQDL